jgi:hypothetical protein
MYRTLLVLFIFILIILQIYNYKFNQSLLNSNIYLGNNSFGTDGIIYIENVFTPSVFQTIKYTCKALNKTLKKDNLIDGIRYGTHINKGYIKNILDSKDFTYFINKIVNNQLKPQIKLSNFPIEYRIYPNKSSGMEWHSDTLLYTVPQYECVFTIENESDSNTLWKNKNQINTIKTKPNSLIIVVANGPLHKVTPINSGFRSILKCIFSRGLPIKNITEHDIKCRYNHC